MEVNEITGQIVEAAIVVHRSLGPGLLESTYEACLAYELRQRGLDVSTQAPLPITYRNLQLDAGCRLDLFVNSRVVVELKSVEEIIPLHEAQLLTYLKLSGAKIGLLINFNVARLKDGLRRFAN